jgi:mRNA interferase RelE/StbE
MYEIRLRKQVAKFIDSRTPKERLRIAEAFSKLRENPFRTDSDIRKLKGSLDKYRLRLGKYRFLYAVMEEQVLIYFYKADTRGDVYK